MALHIKDPEAEKLVRRLAQCRGTTLTEAIRQACMEALQTELPRHSLRERLDTIYRLVESAPPTGEVADKAFFDKEWGETE